MRLVIFELGSCLLAIARVVALDHLLLFEQTLFLVASCGITLTRNFLLTSHAGLLLFPSTSDEFVSSASKNQRDPKRASISTVVGAHESRSG